MKSAGFGQRYTTNAGISIRIYTLTFLFYSANAFIQLMLPLFAQHTGMQSTQIGILVGSYLLASLIVRPWVGGWIEKIGRRTMLVWILIGHGFLLLSGIWADAALWLVIRIFQGGLAAFFSLTVQMWLLDIWSPKQQARVLSLYLLFGLLPSLVVPIVAWTVWSEAGIDGFRQVLLGLSILTGLGLLLVGSNIEGIEKSASVEGNKSPVPRVQSVLQNPGFWSSGLVIAIAMMGVGAVNAFATIHMEQKQIGNPGVFFAFQAGTVIAIRCGLIGMPRLNKSWPAMPVFGMLLSLSAGLSLLAYGPEVGQTWLIWGAAIMIGLGIAHLYPLLVTYLNLKLGASSRKIWLGLFLSICDLGSVVGSMGLGAIGGQIGYGPGFLLYACLVFLLAMIIWVVHVQAAKRF